jgi:hypothetical protein
MSDKPVGQACPTQHWTIVSDAVSDKPTGWVFFSGVHYITTNEMKLVKKHKRNPNKKKEH